MFYARAGLPEAFVFRQSCLWNMMGRSDGPLGRVKKKLGTILMFLVLLIGIGLMAYPTVSNWWNSFHQSRAINSYAARVEEMDPELIEQMLIEAHAYNARLAAGDEARYDEASHTRYMSLLGPAGDGVMGYIEIDKIGVKLPVAHTVEESVLQRSVGHLEGSSLPVGGEGTHAVLSGHRGLPSARLFTDLANLTEGDTFVLTVLEQTLTYEVDQIRVVLPEEVDDLAVAPGEDYCTLVTCTPYGINTHRLLVRGSRVENARIAPGVVADAVKIDPVVVAPFIGIPILLLFFVVLRWERG